AQAADRSSGLAPAGTGRRIADFGAVAGQAVRAGHVVRLVVAVIGVLVARVRRASDVVVAVDASSGATTGSGRTVDRITGLEPVAEQIVATTAVAGGELATSIGFVTGIVGASRIVVAGRRCAGNAAVRASAGRPGRTPLAAVAEHRVVAARVLGHGRAAL